MKITIAVPTRGSLNHNTVWSLIRFQKLYNPEIIIGHNNDSVAYNRNSLVRAFLNGSGTHLLFIDDDVAPPQNLNLPELVRYNKDVLTLPCPINMMTTYGSNYMWNIFPEGDKMTTVLGSGLKQVYASGTGFVLIKRRVLEKIKNPFQITRNEEDAIVGGDDYNFCKNVREAGFEIWTDWENVCGHYKLIDMRDNL